jgi:uncharacterized membrane protein YfcA
MLMVAALMGAASAVGVLFGATLVPSLHPEVIKALRIRSSACFVFSTRSIPRGLHAPGAAP